MSTADAPLLDTRDMVGLHLALSNGLTTAIDAIPTIPDGDVIRARRLADFIVEVLWLIHAHHDGEDALLYPLLSERVPDSEALFSRMEGQHEAVAEGVATATRANGAFAMSASTSDGLALTEALCALRDATDEHVTDEEVSVLPVAAQWISPEEWGALPGHALATYRGDRMWLPLGLVFEAMPDDLRSMVLEHMPPPVIGMWTGGGSEAFAAEMQAIRS
jgi:hypothetical protein